MPSVTSQGLAVSLRGVSFGYPGKEVLSGLDLKIRRGEFVVVVGRSGTGKTTLLRIIAEFEQPLGMVTVNGRVRTVFQEDRLFPWYSARRNISVALNDGPTERADELLEELGMSHLADRYPRQLSGGERQRVAIARAFASNPDIVLMDEPFNSLDVLAREQLQSWLLEFWHQREAAVAFVTHDVEEALLLADRIHVLADGRLLPAISVPFPRPRSQQLRYSVDFLRARHDIRSKFLNGGGSV